MAKKGKSKGKGKKFDKRDEKAFNRLVELLIIDYSVLEVIDCAGYRR